MLDRPHLVHCLDAARHLCGRIKGEAGGNRRSGVRESAGLAQMIGCCAKCGPLHLVGAPKGGCLVRVSRQWVSIVSKYQFNRLSALVKEIGPVPIQQKITPSLKGLVLALV